MESGGQDVALSDQRREAIAPRQNLDAGAGLYDAWSADADHLERPSGEGAFRGHDSRVDLAAIGVALNHGIKQPKRALWRIEDLPRQQNYARAGSKDGFGAAKLLQSFKKTVFFQESQHSGGLATGQDEAIEAGQLLRLAHFDGLRVSLGESLRVAGIVALNGQDADLRAVGQIAL